MADLHAKLLRLRSRLKGEWNEADHPRAEDGKFGPGGAGDSAGGGRSPTAQPGVPGEGGNGNKKPAGEVAVGDADRAEPLAGPWALMARNPVRRALAERGRAELHRLRSAGLVGEADSVYVTGSMVGNKEKPGDIDLVVLVDAITPEQRAWNWHTINLHTGEEEPASKVVRSASLAVKPKKGVQCWFGSREPSGKEYDYAREVQEYLRNTRDKHGDPVKVHGPKTGDKALFGWLHAKLLRLRSRLKGEWNEADHPRRPVCPRTRPPGKVLP